MELISQKKHPHTGCGITYLTMITGKTYGQAEELLFPNGEVDLTGTIRLKKALHKMGFKTSKKLVPFRSRKITDLPFDAIIKTNLRLNGYEWH